MEQLVILLLIGLISLINWIIQKSAEAREKRKLERQRDAGMDAPSAFEGSESVGRNVFDESRRRLAEALGLPEDGLPPAMPEKREIIAPPLPQRPVAVSRFARVEKVSAANPLLREQARRFQAASGEPVRKGGRVRQLLTSSEGVRDAVILSEILGVPKALR
jgi:hypothetical protein